MSHSGTIIYMRNVPGKPQYRALTQPLLCRRIDGSIDYIPVDFEWNGSSSGIFSPIFPRHNHPIASCRHDYRCDRARTPAERAWADREFKKDVATTSWWITSHVGYYGTRIGALLGIGCNY